MTNSSDDEQARLERARRLRETVQEMASDRPRRPSTPRDFTEQRAREAAAEEREKVDPGSGDAAAEERAKVDPGSGDAAAEERAKGDPGSGEDTAGEREADGEDAN